MRPKRLSRSQAGSDSVRGRRQGQASGRFGAASSVPANLSEGHGRCGRDRIHHWRIAYASAEEVDTHLRLFTLAGAVDAEQSAVALNLLDKVRAMTWRLLNPRR